MPMEKKKIWNVRRLYSLQLKHVHAKNTNLQPLDGAEEYTTSPMTFGAIKWP